MAKKLSKDWIDQLCNKYGVKPKDVRDALWPETKTKSLKSLDNVQNPHFFTLLKIADAIGCSIDELMGRKVPSTNNNNNIVAGDNNNVGNYYNPRGHNRNVIESQKDVIDILSKQIEIKDSQISALNGIIERLMQTSESDDNQ